MSDMQSTLTQHGIRLRDFRTGSHKAICPQCSHLRRKKTDPCLSVTISADNRAVWNCHHCDFTGGAGGEYFRPSREKKAYRKPERVQQPIKPDTLFAWFKSRGISQQVVERMGIYKTRMWFPQTNQEEDCIAFPYDWQGELRNVKYRTAKKDFRQEKDPEPVFYNADAIAEDQDLIICEGEIDVLSFLEAGFTHVISLPNGAPSAPEVSDKRYEPFGTHWDAIMKVRRVLIASDMDAPGEFLAQEIARRIGRDRSFRVRMPSLGDVQTKDANECLVEHGADILRECVHHAQPWPIDGLHEVDDFYDAVMDLYHGKGAQPLSTGFSELDKAFKYIPGQFIAVTGIPNHGKSRVIDQIAIQTAQERGEKWAMFSPETGESNHYADLCEIFAKGPFFDGPTLRLSENDVKNALAWMREHIYMLGAVEHTPSIDWLLERARAAVLRYGVTNIVIDPYNELEASRPEKLTETEFVSQLISKCKRFSKHHECTVWMVIHPTKLKASSEGGKEPVPGLYDLAGSAHWRNKADAGLVVYRDYAAELTYIMAKKIRRQPMCGRPGSVKFEFVGADRRFRAILDSYAPLGKESI